MNVGRLSGSVRRGALVKFDEGCPMLSEFMAGLALAYSEGDKIVATLGRTTRSPEDVVIDRFTWADGHSGIKFRGCLKWDRQVTIEGSLNFDKRSGQYTVVG